MIFMAEREGFPPKADKLLIPYLIIQNYPTINGKVILAEREGFEPSVPVKVLQFSRLVH